MNYAIIENGIVVNIAVSVQPLKSNWVAISSGTRVMIGDTYDGDMFYDPDGNVRLSPEVTMTQNRVVDLESAFDSLMGGVSVALGL